MAVAATAAAAGGNVDVQCI